MTRCNPIHLIPTKFCSTKVMVEFSCRHSLFPHFSVLSILPHLQTGCNAKQFPNKYPFPTIYKTFYSPPIFNSIKIHPPTLLVHWNSHGSSSRKETPSTSWELVLEFELGVVVKGRKRSKEFFKFALGWKKSNLHKLRNLFLLITV